MSQHLGDIESIGTIDAESDFKRDYFVPSSAWNNIRAGARPVVIGRKGTGKTALRRALSEEAATDPLVFATPLTFRDYPWTVHNSVFDPSVGGKSRFVETWLFLILVEFAKLVVQVNQAPQANIQGAQVAGAIRSFLENTWGGVTFDHRDLFKQPRFKVVKGKIAPTVLGTGFGSVDWAEVDRSALGDRLSATNRWLKAGIEMVVGDGEYFLVFDELDLDFASQNEIYLDSMIGLILAAQNVFTWSREESLPLRPVVLMRDDIYGSLNFPDKNKITTNLVEPIQWTDEPSGENSLKTVIDRRIQTRLDLADNVDPWFKLFDDELMRGTQTKYLHVVQRTYLRPRDIIQFVNQCIKVARADGGLMDGTRITNRNVTDARVAYSNYLRQELADEIYAHYPEWQDWLELLRRIGRLTFNRYAFNTEAERSSQLSHGKDPAEIMAVLYRFGIIGFARFGGAGKGGTEEYWAYKDPDITFDPNAPYFKVHPGLKENLDLKEERSRKPN